MLMEIGSIIALLVLVAALIEAVWEALKPVFGGGVNWLQNRGIPVDRIATLIIALVICLGVGSMIDLFALLGLTLGVKYLGSILTAIILARGSNFVHDLFGTIGGIMQNNKPLKIEAEK